MTTAIDTLLGDITTVDYDAIVNAASTARAAADASP